MTLYNLSSYISDFFYFNNTEVTEIYTLSLHERSSDLEGGSPTVVSYRRVPFRKLRQKNPRASERRFKDRKSTRLNSSHRTISYAVFCLKKKTILNIRHYAIF